MSDEPLATIVAPATPVGRSALAIIRLDGPESARIVAELAGRSEGSFQERRATRVMLRSAETPLDDCLAIRYEAPRSFTGNDMMELITHGAPVVVEALMRETVSRGARIAEPGEFSERAVLNGKLDLVQAEAVGDLIASRTRLQAKLSLANLEGRLSAEANRVRADLLHVISRLEAALDFAEEGYEFISREEAIDQLSRTQGTIESIAGTYARGRAARSGLSLVILGQPNVGKSTLLNYLCGSERAIVADTPGTTRDLLRETVEVGGLPVTLVDTAGLRRTDEPVELIGMERARREAAAADLVLYLVDAARGIDAEDQLEIGALQPLVVYTKIDLAPAPAGETGISVPGGSGLTELLDRLDREVQQRFAPGEHDPTVVNARQEGAMKDCADAIACAVAALADGRTEELVLVDLYRAAGALGLLTGSISNREILREIFAKFCIGK